MQGTSQLPVEVQKCKILCKQTQTSTCTHPYTFLYQISCQLLEHYTKNSKCEVMVVQFGKNHPLGTTKDELLYLKHVFN